MRFTASAISLAVLTACSGGSFVDVSIQQARTQRIGPSGFLALDLLATHGDDTIPCNDGTFEIEVTVSGADGHFASLPPQNWEVTCDDGRAGDLALVVDNSGSEEGFLPWLQDAARVMADEILGRGGRVSIVRVSTNASVVQPLTDSPQLVDDALNGLFINNGWTALWDGVRMGNETLDGSSNAPAETNAIADFCRPGQALGVVAFTDGFDNNSADEKAAQYDASKYPGDGIPTTIDTLRQLSVGGATTPIYGIGLGNQVDAASLDNLAVSTGARYLGVNYAEDIPGVFSVVQGYMDATHQVCVELPEQECGDYTLRINWSWTPAPGAEPIVGTVEEPFTYACPVSEEPPSEGRVATLLLTVGDPGISDALASTLAQQSVEWVSPKLRPNVLVIRDDGNNGEDADDPVLIDYILDDVDNLGADFIEEPNGGLTAADLEGYDVVWFSNPGHPMNDETSFIALMDFVEAGGGLVLQGDDMTWSKNQAFNTSPLTHTEHINNGTRACGQRIDNNSGGTYTVTFANDSHAITRGLEGTTFTYGNDIDHNAALGEGEVVLATAVPTDDPTCMDPIPVIIGYNP